MKVVRNNPVSPSVIILPPLSRLARVYANFIVGTNSPTML